MKVEEMLEEKGDRVATVRPDATIATVINLLKLEGIGAMVVSEDGHLPVTKDGALSGIVSIGDVVKNRLQELETETNVLRDYIVGRTG